MELDATDRRLLSEFQRDLPLEPRPFQILAERLSLTEAEVIARLQRLQDEGAISRVGAVFRPGRVGASTLAAMAVPPERLDDIAALVSAYPEVNHNYQREHQLNLWFVVTAADEQTVAAVLAAIQTRTGIAVVNLPLEQDFYIDLGFPLEWG